ncbi:AAA family ATPase [Micromonospora sp. NPDC050686]|uniref:AAA family ATPase n=1 Tax=Micromonospora sp. NPDC050686 TaxID=3154631 RepID=UPI0033C5B90A
MAGDQSLLDQVFERLAEDNVADEVVDLVLGAYVGNAALDAVLSGEPADLPERDPSTRPRPQPLFLESVTVAGFRGVSPQQRLRLQPHTGLTLVIGRNGSGKSSYAEAVELGLTGNSARWADRNSVFKDGWRKRTAGRPARSRCCSAPRAPRPRFAYGARGATTTREPTRESAASCYGTRWQRSSATSRRRGPWKVLRKRGATNDA